MATDDDKAWLDILAGQAVPDADPTLVRQAQAVRNELLRREHEAIAGADVEDQVSRFRVRIAAEGRRVHRFPNWMRKAAAWFTGFRAPQFALAACLILAVGLGQKPAAALARAVTASDANGLRLCPSFISSASPPRSSLRSPE